jgi:hypothetical protein
LALSGSTGGQQPASQSSQTEPGTGPTLNLKELGARGDGVHNDSAAFRAAAKIIQDAGGGRLIIPPGTYLVGEQVHEDGKYPYYRSQPIFSVQNVDGLSIEGDGATIRLAAGLRYGSFDKDTGQPFEPKPGGFTDGDYAVNVGVMLQIYRSRNVRIRGLELDGNSDALILGGYWGDTGRQLHAYGIELANNTDVVVENVHTHHHGLDGIAIGWAGLKESDPPTPHTLINVVSEHNSRQGLSWVGGRGLKAIRCKFNHTGRGKFQSSPGAGLDIEAENSVCRDGYFENCEFINNGGCAMVADSGDGGYTHFVRCTFWGVSNWSTWSGKPGLVFEDCRIYGTAVHGYGSTNAGLATRYVRCHFEDKDYDAKGVYRNAAVINCDSDGDNITYEDCTVIANKTRAIWFDSGKGRKVVRGCRIINRNLRPEGGFVVLLRGVHIENTRFEENYPPDTTDRYRIEAQGGVTIDDDVFVTGPVVQWGGRTGRIPPTNPEMTKTSHLLRVGLEHAVPVGEFRQAHIYLPADASPALQQAATDLREYVTKLTGQELLLKLVANAGGIPADRRAFVLGKLAVALGLSVPATEYGVDGFAYDVSGQFVRLAGESDTATHYAVADFLEKQGVRWFTPGPFGEDVPRCDTVWLPDAPVRQTPSFFARHPWYNGGEPAGGTAEDHRAFELWCRRNKVRGDVYLDCGHAWDSVLAASGGRTKLFAEHPDWFGEVDGKRVPNQLNLTHPAVVDLFVAYYRERLEGKPRDVRAILSISPDDGLVRDESAASRRFVTRNDLTFAHLPDVTDLVLQFANAVQTKLAAEYPNARLGVFIYSNHQAGPQRVKLHANLLPVFAPLHFGRYHALGDPRSPTRYMLEQTVDRVAAQQVTFGWYDYSYLCPDTVMPFTRLHMVSSDLPRLHAKGCRYYMIETAKNWPNYLPDYYLMTRLAWDVNSDQAALLDEFYARYFGPAAAMMQAYLEELSAAYQALPFSAGNKEFVGAVFTPTRLIHWRELINRAGVAVKADPVCAHRVEMFDRVLAQGERFMEMRAAVNRLDFAGAEQLNRQILSAWDDAIAFDSLMTNEFLKKSWYTPYYGDLVAKLAEWTSGAEILHRFPDEWPAYFDFTDTGELEGAMREETPLFNFLKLKTYSACLAEQGWERYRGPIWYRQSFPQPRVPTGKKLALLIGGADCQTKAWVDNQLVGEQEAGNFGPLLFELPAIDPARSEHTLTLRIVNYTSSQFVNELGTGGLLRPVAILAK